MAVKIRLTRMGGHKKPFYRVVAADSESPRDGRFLEVLNHYDPAKDLDGVSLKIERIKYWLSKGAKPTLTVSQLLKKKG
ncbi:MAG TPA: 30S ribosomal protein S16 [Syntrophus sp. (in: bacteria)]|nr:30S ribosomal protein S16 [Syntrophus sp. (in: bacteria)]